LLILCYAETSVYASLEVSSFDLVFAHYCFSPDESHEENGLKA
jgi:hypothetical protein